ncbi:peptide chain release factor 3 [Serinibacter arcticus]|uniref:Peptide chain release factor 3 n=1 Tax=Serinibacter arcticus TaxID=1655435 RepID=A0A4Z1E1U4_9MICO|nr:peptide chain release factor 3 [Serinibacter arcticus]TGO03777.1 Peptide chain release factor 3 [Serinibacter arcticus]
MSQPLAVPAREAARRRSIAVISHPDAGKSTLTEAIALHANMIREAGSVHGRGGRSGVVSDWLELEQRRGISITSAALQFEYHDLVINLLDTPGHADFSEDTYRVLMAVDVAIMLLDAAKGIEPQTLRLFEVCRERGVPVITFVNKWDRPGKEALELCDEIETRLSMTVTPVTWPVGDGGHFRGLLKPADNSVTFYERAPGGATLAESTTVPTAEARLIAPADTAQAEESCGLLGAPDPATFAAGRSTPLLFGTALANIGVRELLDTIETLAPSPPPRPQADGTPRPVDSEFSGFVFKMQAGMDKQHRDHVAFVRVCSGEFTRGMGLVHGPTGRPIITKHALSMFGRDRQSVEHAYPGDVVGLVNAALLAVGDTLYSPDGPPAQFPPMPAFAPKHFAVARVADPGRSKQFRRGITQLEHEGVVQVLVSPSRGDATPILAAVGPLQFEVATFRMANEFNAEMRVESLNYELARRASPSDETALAGAPGVEIARRSDGENLALFRDQWRLRSLTTANPALELAPLFADQL